MSKYVIELKPPKGIDRFTVEIPVGHLTLVQASLVHELMTEVAEKHEVRYVVDDRGPELVKVSESRPSKYEVEGG